MSHSFAPASRRSGFSLIELSIVLVILGLLTGGILSGQSLIRAAELRSISEEYSRYVASVRTFRDKYFAIPGDMSNATSFWGTAGTCPGQTATPSTTTCNGDGDGQVEVTATSNESYRFWQQLANAGIIEGSYTGTTAASAGSALTLWSEVGVNVPRSRIGLAGWTPIYIGTVIEDGTASGNANIGTLFEGTYDHVFSYGTVFATGAQIHATSGPLLKPEEAWNIDTKLDDGKPGTGLLRTHEAQGNATTGCSNLAASTSTAIGATSEYLLSNSDTVCSLVFKIGI